MNILYHPNHNNIVLAAINKASIEMGAQIPMKEWMNPKK